MNEYLGPTVEFIDQWRVRSKIDELVSPGPADTFVFICEHPDSISAGVFIVPFSAPKAFGETLISVPSSHHGRSGVISFADGHVEKHQWKDPRTVWPLRHARIPPTDLRMPNNPDPVWLRERTARLSQ